MATYQVKTKSGVFQVTTKPAASSTTQPPQQIQQSINPVSFAGNIAKESVANIVGPGLRNYIPGLEQPAVRSGIDASQDLERRIFDPLTNKVPDTRLPRGIGAGAGPLGIAAEELLKPTYRDVAKFPTEGSLDPRFLAGGVAGFGKPLKKLVSQTIPANLERNAAEKLAKAEGMFTKVADIPKGVVSEAAEQGRKVPGVEYGTKATKKSKTVGELFQTIVGEKKKAGAEKAEVIASLPQTDLPRTYLRNARAYIDKLAKEGIHDPNEIKKVSDLLDQEIDFLNKTPESAKDPVYFDERKQIFQREAAPLYKKIEAGTATGLERESYNLYDALAKGYRSFLEGLDPRVIKANQKSRGLIEATEFLRGPMEAEATTNARGIVSELINALRGGPASTGAAAFRNLFGHQVPFDRTSGRIEKLVRQSESKTRLAESMRKPFAKEAPTPATLEYPAQLMAPEPRQIETSGAQANRTRMKDILSGKMLPGGTGSGPTIKVPGSSTINLPEMTQSQIDELARKYGVPEFSGIKESFQKPTGKLAKRGYLEEYRLGKEGRLSLKRLFERSKKRG